MKIFKIISLIILSVFIIAYCAFLFVLPSQLDLNKYTPEITKEIEKASGFKVVFTAVKLKTAWNLSGGIGSAKMDLFTPDGKKIAQINNMEVRLSLIPLIFGQIKFDTVKAEKLLLNLDVEKSGKFTIEKYLTSPKTQSQSTPSIPLKFSNTMPDFNVKKYRISFIDASSGRIYSVKGSDFKIRDFVLDKKIKVSTKGDVVLNDRKQVEYDISISSKYDLAKTPQQKTSAQPLNILNIFEDLYKYNLRSTVMADLKLDSTSDETQINGDLSLKNISCTIESKTLPPSNINLKFNKDKIGINADFYTDLTKKATITGIFNNGKKKSVNLNVKSRSTNIKNTFLIANTLLEMIGKKDLQGISANGNLSADFNIKSDFKKIQSSGYLKINDANIIHNLYNVALNSINADIDFSDNRINILKSSAFINSEPISLKGSIDTNANANILLFAQNLQIKGLLATLGQMDTLRENDFYGGRVDLNVALKGRLDKALPIIEVKLSNVNLRNKPNQARISLPSAKIKMTPNGKKLKGNAELKGLKVISQGKVFSIPELTLSFDEKDLNIDKGTLYINSSRVDIFGKVTDYSSKKINFDITARGLILSNDIKSMLPPQNQKGVVAVGKIPLLVRITGSQKQKIHAQMLANNSNYVSVFDINSLRGKTSLINAELTLNGNEITVDEITLYELQSNKGLSQNMAENLSLGLKVAGIKGKITDINSQNPIASGLHINIPKQISTSIPGYRNSLLQLKGDVSLNGQLNNPQINGGLDIPILSLPSYKINAKDFSVQFNKNTVLITCPLLRIDSSIMSFNALADKNFSRGIVIKNLDFLADYINLDSLSTSLASLPQNTNGPGTDLGVTILGGSGKIQKFKTGGIIATNVSSNITLKNNILKLDNTNADAYFGKVAGNISYDFVYGKTGLKLQGRGLNAEPALKALSGIPQAPSGKLDFDSDLTLIGYTQEQLIRSMRGSTKFIISNGRMNKLGQLEHLLYAQNILSNNFFKATLNVIAKALTVKNTGNFRYIKGEMTFSQGWANLSYIKTSGPSMSMYITGKYNLLNNSANLIVLGRLSDEIVKVLGPLGELSMDKILSYIPKIGAITSSMINQMTTDPEYENTSLIPPLSPPTDLPTKDFKVVINGGIESQSSVKSFKWLSKPQVAQPAQTTQQIYIPPKAAETVQNVQKRVREVSAPVADFINSLPDLKN